MDEEPLQDSNNRTPLIILGVAALILVIVAAISFTKFVAAQKDPGNQAATDETGKPRTREDWAEYERQRLRDQLLESGGVISDPQSEEPTDTTKKVKVGQVINFSAEWNFVTMNIGSEQNIKKGDEFYVAREEIIKGVVKVDQVSPNQSIAIFVTENNFSEFLSPQKGDEIRVIEN